MSAISDLYIEQQVVSALLEAFDMDPDDMAEGTTRRFIEALDDRDIELRPR